MKTAFITGGSSGIGQAVIAVFENSGWKVIAPNKKELNLYDSANIQPHAANLTKNTQHLDAVIHIAGIWHGTDEVFANRSLENFSPEQIATTMSVGLSGFMVLCAVLLPKLSKNGTIVGITGTFSDGANGWLPYYTSKRGLEDFLVGLSQDYPKGPRVYGISPADTATPAYKKYYPEYADEAQSPKVIADLCLSLVNEETKAKTGDIVEIRDGKVLPGFHV